jgi:DNA-binding NarL/FixJ family response regulator
MRSPEAAPRPRWHPPPPQATPTDRDTAVSTANGGTVPMIRTSSHLTAAPRVGVAESAPDWAEPLGRGGSTVGDDHVAAAPDAGVTADELMILALLANGLALDAVAARVAVSPRTLSRRLRSICDRLEVAHPIQAVVWAARRGLI